MRTTREDIAEFGTNWVFDEVLRAKTRLVDLIVDHLPPPQKPARAEQRMIVGK